MYYCEVFTTCFDSHSDGTHSLHMILWWASDVMLNFSKSVQMRKQTHLHLGWPDGGYIFFSLKSLGDILLYISIILTYVPLHFVIKTLHWGISFPLVSGRFGHSWPRAPISGSEYCPGHSYHRGMLHFPWLDLSSKCFPLQLNHKIE